jgi:hypothetical protein
MLLDVTKLLFLKPCMVYMYYIHSDDHVTELARGRGSFSSRDKVFSRLPNVLTDRGTRLASYAMGTWGSYPACKAAWA